MIENNPVLLVMLCRLRGAIMAPSLGLSRGDWFDLVTAPALAPRRPAALVMLVHCNCGQLCGQPVCGDAQAARIQALRQIA